MSVNTFDVSLEGGLMTIDDNEKGLGDGGGTV
jgi:hypothetical protein